MAPIGRPRQFTLEDILDAGLALIEEEGLGALTMNAVAARLGTGRATLYNYVESREELIDLMLGRALSEERPLAVALEDKHWAEALEDHMVTAFRNGVKRPALLQLSLATPRLHLGVAARGQEEILALQTIGFTPTRAAEVFRILVTQLLGHLAAAAALANRPPTAVLDSRTELGAAQQHLDAMGEERLYASAVGTLVAGLTLEVRAWSSS